MADGKRGPGRPRHVPPVKRHCVMLTEEQVKLLRMWGRGDVSAGVRWVIDVAKLLVQKPPPRQAEDQGQ